MDIITSKQNSKQYYIDIWNFRDLFLFLAWRDILLRYKQTIMGISWSFIKPLLTVVVFTFIFGKIAKLNSEGVPYTILVLTGILPWQLFANTVINGSESLINDSPLITKVYFPKIIIPSASLAVSFIDFIICLFFLIAVMLWYNFIPCWKIIFIPFFIVINALVSLGFAYWLSALNVKYRDFRHTIPFMMQFFLYISPVGFSNSIIPLKFQTLYALNPMVGVIEVFRWSIIGQTHIELPNLIISLSISFLVFLTGFKFFRKSEIFFADII